MIELGIFVFGAVFGMMAKYFTDSGHWDWKKGPSPITKLTLCLSVIGAMALIGSTF